MFIGVVRVVFDPRPSVNDNSSVFFRDRRAHIALILGLCALSFFSALGSTPLWEPDEPRFADATRQMLRTGDLLDPVFNARPRWEKPILLYWLQAAPLALGLNDEVAMRLPAAMLGTAAVIAVYVLGTFWWSRVAGLVSGALLATSFRFVTYARQGLTDVPAAAGIVATFLAFEIGTAADASRRQRLAWWAGWIAVGLTALTKGPLALIAPPIWIAVTWIHRREAIRWSAIAAGVVLASVVGGSWFAYMAVHRGDAFVGVNNYEFLERYFDPSFPGPPRGPLFYVTILPGEIAPWTLIVVAAALVLIGRWKSFDARIRHGVLVAAAWFVGVLAICSFSQYKLPHYALPAYPPLMLLTGLAIDRAIDSWRRVMVAAIAITALVLIGAGVAGAAALTRLPDTFRIGVSGVATTLFVGGVAGLSLVRRKIDVATVVLAATTAVTYCAAAILLLPAFATEAYPYPALGRLVAENVPRSVTLGSIGAHTSLVYYADRPVTFLTTTSEAAVFLKANEPRLLVLSRVEFSAIEKDAATARAIAMRRHQAPRLSRLLEGRFSTAGTEELLVGNAPALAIYGRRE